METTNKVDEWYEENVVDDKEDNDEIGRLASERVLNVWNIGIGGTDDCRTPLAFYGIVYGCIINALSSRRKEKKSFAISLADIVTIGYDDAEFDENQEKLGSFCPVIIDGTKRLETSDDANPDSLDRTIEWKSKSLITKGNQKIISEIETEALKQLKEVGDIYLGSPDPVFAIFCTIHEQMVEYMKIKQAETGDDDCFITFAGCFDIHVSKGKDDEVIVQYKPAIWDKLSIKGDHLATAVHE